MELKPRVEFSFKQWKLLDTCYLNIWSILRDLRLNGSTCFLKISRENKNSYAQFFMVVLNCNGGSQSGGLLTSSLITAANQMDQSILGDPH